MGANWFVALQVPGGPWLQSVPPAPPFVKRFVPQDLHMTVAFLGPVGEERAQRAWQARGAWSTTSLTITLGAVVPMGHPRRFSALSAELKDGHDEIARAMTEMRGRLWTAAGAREDTRPARPHVTLARVARKSTHAERAAAIAWANGIQLPSDPIRLTTLALYTHSQERSQRFSIVQAAEL